MPVVIGFRLFGFGRVDFRKIFQGLCKRGWGFNSPQKIRDKKPRKNPVKPYNIRVSGVSGPGFQVVRFCIEKRTRCGAFVGIYALKMIFLGVKSSRGGFWGR